ncbi:MAG: asparaginase domain-containing protein [Cypionkella sp.]|nr:asparaginase domain-containing protein [Cypionkella sp.]
MLPLGAEGTDARRNLGDALIAAFSAPAGVWVQFAGRLMQGARVRKAHSHAHDAFTASAAPDLARRGGDAAHLPYGAPEIAVLTMAPNMSARAFDAALGACDGAVLRVFGAGTIPNDPAIATALEAAHARGAPMIVVFSTIEKTEGVALEALMRRALHWRARAWWTEAKSRQRPPMPSWPMRWPMAGAQP